VYYLSRRDPRIRLDDYKRALRFYLRAANISPLIFCENSGSELAELRRIYETVGSHKQVEFLSFRDRSPGGLGKGYGEIGILSHVLANSSFVHGGSRILKITGRLAVRNIDGLIRQAASIQDSDVICDLRDNLLSADSRVFCATTGFLERFLIPLRPLVDDSKGLFLEHILARAVHEALAQGLRWSMLPVTPNISGIAGTADRAYPDGWFHYMRRELFREIKSRVLSR
jgi:hypothetical protein